MRIIKFIQATCKIFFKFCEGNRNMAARPASNGKISQRKPRFDIWGWLLGYSPGFKESSSREIMLERRTILSPLPFCLDKACHSFPPLKNKNSSKKTAYVNTSFSSLDKIFPSSWKLLGNFACVPVPTDATTNGITGY